MDVVERIMNRNLLALGEERSLADVMRTLSLPVERDPRRPGANVDPRSGTNTWDYPLDGEHASWDERVTVWCEPAESAEVTSLRVQHSIVLPRDGAVESGWVVGTKALLDAWSKRLATECGAKPTKMGSMLEFAREGRPTLSVSRAKQGSAKAWHTVSTEIVLVPRT